MKSLLIALATLLSAHTAAMECPVIPIVPAEQGDQAFIENWVSVAPPLSVRDAKSKKIRKQWGVGYLAVLNNLNKYYDWPLELILPLWKTSDEHSFTGWIINGKVTLSNTLSFPLSGVGLLEIEYEHTNFIVFTAKENGWLQIRVGGNSEKYWTHQCHLGIGNTKLVYKPWENFMERNRDWLHYRSKVPHSLREEPWTGAKRITKIGRDQKLIMHEIKKNWMRVTVEQPDTTCGGAEGVEVTVHEGWIRWKDEEMGPWVFSYPRGC